MFQQCKVVCEKIRYVRCRCVERLCGDNDCCGYYSCISRRSYTETEENRRMSPLDLKEVLVKFDALTFVLPTFSLGF